MAIISSYKVTKLNQIPNPMSHVVALYYILCKVALGHCHRPLTGELYMHTEADPGGPIRPWTHPFWLWTLAPINRRKTFFSLNFPNLCDHFVKKLVSEIRKCRQLLTPDHYMLAQTCSHACHVV